jgi:GTPase SAR1 family protein
MELFRGKRSRAIKCLLYGPEGIGKSTFSSKFPNPVFIDTEGGTDYMEVSRTPKPSSWTMIMEQVKYFINHHAELGTLVIDTVDWAEKMCIEHVCASKQVKGIEDFGYGRGYIYLAEEFGRLLNLLDELMNKGVHILLVAHASMRKFEQPDELGSYDRWELKLGKKTAPLVKEWVDTILLANYKTLVINVDGQGAQKGKNKAQGGKRIMYTSHHPCWDAKNRWDLPEELPFEFAAIAHCIPTDIKAAAPEQITKTEAEIKKVFNATEISDDAQPQPKELSKPEISSANQALVGAISKLEDLMKLNDVSVEEIQKAVSQKGYYPTDTPISNYDSEFIDGVLICAWDQVFGMIKNNRKNGGNKQ